MQKISDANNMPGQCLQYKLSW